METTVMDAERWQTIERLYHATLECKESQRDAFLTSACGDDEALRREVASLISYGNRTGRFIEESALEVIAPDLALDGCDGLDPVTEECAIIEKMIGKRISQYRVVEHLGSGGMGEVYRAVRADDQFEKQVAIKLVHAGEASGFIISRFKKERQILASLDHPNIARLHDGGATEEGVPYFVMELVEGQPIDKYCDSKKLGIATRLKLFLQVCSALEYAHQHQIIHRDIKPANILVTEEGVPKLLDFGIAKILDSEALAGVAGEVGKTQTMFRAFTPEYASPEQIKAAPISTASDVYSLGVLLYELLTGHRPYRFKTRTPAEIEQAICEEEPLKPSTVVTRVEEQNLADGTTTSITPGTISKARDSDPKRMHSCLLGDLDAIVMTALRKEPHRRYASADDLSQDVRKHLDGRPITARPSTITYRGTKFLRRHRELAVAVGMLVFLVALASLAIVRRWEVGRSATEPPRDVVRRQLTANTPGDQIRSAAISRDGKYLAYGDKAWKIYLVQIDSGELRQLPSSDFIPVCWFPDGNHLLVEGRGPHSGLWKMSIADGASRKLLDAFGFAALSPDGLHIAYLKPAPAVEIWLMGANGEQPHRIAEFDAVDYIDSLSWSPRGQRLVYTRYYHEAAVIETCDLQGAERTLILSEPRLLGRDGVSSVYWLRDGRILYNIPDPSSYSDYNVWAIATDVGSGKRVGPPVRLTSREKWAWDFQASADGKRLIYTLFGHSDAIYLASLEVGAFDPRRLTLDEWDTFPSDWTRDSAAILFQSIRNGRFAVLQQKIDKQTPEILLSGAESYQWPILSPAGDRLLYTASPTVDRADPSKRLMSVPVDGGLRSVLLVGNYSYHCGSLPSARCVLGEVKGHQLTFYILDAIEGKGAEIHSVEISPPDTRWALSPDGQKIAVILNASEGKVGILTLADRPIVTLVPRGWKWDILQAVAWSADGSHLFATAWADTSSCVLLSIDLHGNLQVLDETNSGDGWLNKPVASPDGRYLAYMKRTYDSTVVMLEHF